VRVSATNPLTAQPVTSASAAVEFFNPTKDPVRDPSERTPDSVHPLSYDEAARAYIATVPTVGWQPGRWTYRPVLSGSYDSWEYAAVDVLP